ncbi:hypothetical protein LB504_012987 [Fusarium proliferatum]|nr:hypothetical protein LB504_012987 [Fusarium proliferatum]
MRKLHLPSQHKVHPRVLKIHRPLRLMPLGGSITQGVGSPDRNGYREDLLKLLEANNYSVEMVGSRNIGTMQANSHEGWRGFRIDEIEKKARSSVTKLLPNLFTVNAGSNDCLQNFEMDTIADRMSGLLDYLWAASPGSTVVLSTLVVNRDAAVDSNVLSANRAFRRLVEEKLSQEQRIVLADMYTQEGPVAEDLGDDDTHPGADGYKKIATIWYRAIEVAAAKGFLDKA